MDVCLSLLIQVEGIRLLRGRPRLGARGPIDIFLVNPEASPAQVRRLLSNACKPIVVLVHWDDFFRSLSAPIRLRWGPAGPFRLLPGRVHLPRVKRMIQGISPDARVIVPQMFQNYDLSAMVAQVRSS
jgi:hypothetical protein